MHAQEVMRDVSDNTLPLPVVDTTHKTIVDILNRCVGGGALSHTTQEGSFILYLGKKR
jgi:hypothetical protein